MAVSPGGVTALVTLALLNSGVEPERPEHRERPFAFLRELQFEPETYSVALQTMVLCTAEPKRDRLLIETVRRAGW